MERDLINRADLKEKYVQMFRDLGQFNISEHKIRREQIKKCIALLDDAKSADAIDVVRCAECQHSEALLGWGVSPGTMICGNPCSFAHKRMVTLCDYCPYGERRCE